jgi:hypothetical protein
VVCYECGKENASMNPVCAYCDIPFAEHNIAVLRREAAARAPLAHTVLLAVLVPIVGWIAYLVASAR